jgi:hypothetical protein
LILLHLRRVPGFRFLLMPTETDGR